MPSIRLGVPAQGMTGTRASDNVTNSAPLLLAKLSGLLERGRGVAAGFNSHQLLLRAAAPPSRRDYADPLYELPAPAGPLVFVGSQLAAQNDHVTLAAGDPDVASKDPRRNISPDDQVRDYRVINGSAPGVGQGLQGVGCLKVPSGPVGDRFWRDAQWSRFYLCLQKEWRWSENPTGWTVRVASIMVQDGGHQRKQVNSGRAWWRVRAGREHQADPERSFHERDSIRR